MEHHCSLLQIPGIPLGIATISPSLQSPPRRKSQLRVATVTRGERKALQGHADVIMH